MPIPSSNECEYAKCFCEENIYKLCQRVTQEDLDQYYVSFLSNELRSFPMFAQKACQRSPFIVWDYHVILIKKGERTSESQIFDLDTTLSFPTPFLNYCDHSFPIEFTLSEEYARRFRIISASNYLIEFSSDRRHMRKNDGSWIIDPPKWSPIYNEAKGHNLDDFISMNEDSPASRFSTVLNEADFRQHF